jgi:hypothetical protein
MSGRSGKLREKGIWVTKIGHLGLGIIVVAETICLLNEGEYSGVERGFHWIEVEYEIEIHYYGGRLTKI